jgi:hypothetical protein
MTQARGGLGPSREQTFIEQDLPVLLSAAKEKRLLAYQEAHVEVFTAGGGIHPEPDRRVSIGVLVWRKWYATKQVMRTGALNRRVSARRTAEHLDGSVLAGGPGGRSRPRAASRCRRSDASPRIRSADAGGSSSGPCSRSRHARRVVVVGGALP